MSQLTLVPFHGDRLMVVAEKGQLFIPIKPVSDRLGLVWDAQFRRIKRHRILASTVAMMAMVADDGKRREMLCLPLPMFHGWLVQIDLERVNAEAQPMVEWYQRDAFQAIADHFSLEKDRELKKTETKALRSEMAYFKRYPERRLIRDMALKGEPYWYVGQVVRRSPGTVGKAVAHMIEWGMMTSSALVAARIGMSSWWAYRRKHRHQLSFF